MKKTIQPTMRKVYGQTATNSQEVAVRKINSLLSSGAVSVTGPTQQRLMKPQQKTVFVQKGECYVCDEHIGSNGTLVTEALTSVSNTKIPTKIGRIVGDAFMVIISVDDVICKRCLTMFNHMDRLENDLDRVKTNILNLINAKYGISDGGANASNAIEVKPPPAKIQRLSGGSVQYANRKTSNGGDADDLGTRKVTSVPLLHPLQSTTQTRIMAAGGLNDSNIDGQIYELDQQQNNYVQPQQQHLLQQQQTIKARHSVAAVPSAEKKAIKIYKCMSCDFKTTDLKQFQPHYETCRQQNGYRCKICKKTFASMNALKIHSQEKHPNEYTCSICSIGFGNELTFKKHMETNHPDVKTIETNTALAGQLFSCNICTFKTADKATYDEHLRKHVKVKPFKCRICSQRFETREQAGVHAKTHCPDYFKCGTCSMSFPQREQLLKHFETHKPQQQVQPKQQLVQQQQIVSQDLTTQKLLQDTIDEALRDTGDAGQKIHFRSCQICSLTFIQETYYKQHMETHKRDGKKGGAVTAHTSNSNAQSLIKQEVRATGTPTTIIQTQGNQALTDNDLEIMFEKMHSEKTEIEGSTPGPESLVITSQESSTGGYTFNITMPAHQLEQSEHNVVAEDDEDNKDKADMNAIGIDMPVLDTAEDQQLQQMKQEANESAEQDKSHEGIDGEQQQTGPPVSMPSLDDDGDSSQPSNTDQVPMDLDEIQNAAESGQIKFILNENGQLLQLDNHILTTDADGNQILVQGTDSEQIQQLLQSVGVLHTGDGDGETFQMIQGENNQMILVQGDNNETQLIDASMLNEDGHLVIQQHGDGELPEGMHVVNEDGVQVPVSIAFAQHVDDGSEHQQAEIKLESDSQDGENVQVSGSDEAMVTTTTTATATSTAPEVFFNLDDLMCQTDQK